MCLASWARTTPITAANQSLRCDLCGRTQFSTSDCLRWAFAVRSVSQSSPHSPHRAAHCNTHRSGWTCKTLIRPLLASVCLLHFPLSYSPYTLLFLSYSNNGTGRFVSKGASMVRILRIRLTDVNRQSSKPQSEVNATLSQDDMSINDSKSFMGRTSNGLSCRMSC